MITTMAFRPMTRILTAYVDSSYLNVLNRYCLVLTKRILLARTYGMWQRYAQCFDTLCFDISAEMLISKRNQINQCNYTILVSYFEICNIS